VLTAINVVNIQFSDQKEFQKLYMNVSLIKQALSNLVSRFNHPQQDALPPQVDAIYQELIQLEQSLREFTACPTSAIRPPNPLTEQQKIIDLAG
jgi:hypothetical protein